MGTRYRQLSVCIILILTTCFALVCPASEPPDPNRYLDAVREFADNVLKFGRDTYGPKHTPSTACPSLGCPIRRLQRA